MKLRTYTPHLIVLGMLIAATVAVRQAGTVSLVSDPAVAAVLPDRVGDWMGEETSYCQNETCMKSWPTAELPDRGVCPSCGGAMSASWSLSERRNLPADTILMRKTYRRGSDPALLVSIVVSGTEVVSIHRPEICLTGQGYDIAGDRTQTIPLAGREPLRVQVMSLFHRRQVARGAMAAPPLFFAYWFVSPTRETPSSAMRIFSAAWDRVVRGRVCRWAYVSVAGERLAGAPDADRELAAFLRDLYPLLMAKEER